MQNLQISSTQLLILMIFTQIGSSIVVGIGMDAKQDAWLAILVAMFTGILLFQIYNYLHQNHPTIPLSKFPEKILGRFFGRLLSFFYMIYFFYIAGRVLRDFGELISISLLPETPLIMILILMSTVILYTSVKGLETLARCGEILFPYMIMWGGLLLLFILISNLPEAEKLQPVLENGWKPILQTAFPEVLTFPFGETIVFSLIFSYVKDKKHVGKIGALSIVISGIIIVITTLMNLSVLGPTIASMEKFPLLETTSKVNIADVFQRLDPLVICILMVGGYFKISIFFCFSMMGLKDIFSVKYPKRWDFIFAVLLVVISILMADSYHEHIKIGLEIVPKYIHVPFQIVIPCSLALIVFIKKKLK